MHKIIQDYVKDSIFKAKSNLKFESLKINLNF